MWNSTEATLMYLYMRSEAKAPKELKRGLDEMSLKAERNHGSQQRIKLQLLRKFIKCSQKPLNGHHGATVLCSIDQTFLNVATTMYEHHNSWLLIKKNKNGAFFLKFQLNHGRGRILQPERPSNGSAFSQSPLSRPIFTLNWFSQVVFTLALLPQRHLFSSD